MKTVPQKSWLMPAALATLSFVVFVLSPNITSFDSRWTIPVAESILHQGNINLDEYPALLQENTYYHILNIRGHQYSYFPIGASLVALPFVWVADHTIQPILTHVPQLKTLIVHRSHDPITAFDVISLHQPIELVIASLLSALAVLFIYLVIGQLAKKRSVAVVGALLFAFGTSMWSVVSRGLWQHTPGVLISTLILWLLVKPKKGQWSFIGVGLLLGFSYIVRPTYSIMIVALLGYIWFEHRSRFWLTLRATASVLILFVLSNLQTYHALLPPYDAVSRLVIGPNFLPALSGNVFSPARGLFIFSPWLLFSFYRLRQGKLSTLEKVSGVIIVAHWVGVSMQNYWWGGHTFGPRYMSDLLPYFMVFMAPVLSEMFRRRQKFYLALFGVLALFSVMVHYRGASDWSTYLWNTQPNNIDQHSERIWDWRDLQFLR